MTDPLAELKKHPRSLRTVTLAGGPIGSAGMPFLWALTSSAPPFGKSNAFDKKGDKSGVTADHVHTLRVVVADDPRAGVKPPAWRRPRLIDLHLVVGATSPQYSERGPEGLTLSFSDQPITIAAKGGAVLRTIPECDPETEVKVAGAALDQATKEKLVTALANVTGVVSVEGAVATKTQEAEAVIYTVRKGDTLWGIAKAHYGDGSKYPAIFEANRPMLKSPDRIYPGQALRIPQAGGSVAAPGIVPGIDLDPDSAIDIVARKAPFVRVIAEPLPLNEEQWPRFDPASRSIPVPPLRAVAGRIGLRVTLTGADGKPIEALQWLKSLGITSEKVGTGKEVQATIWLVPDGIEFDATLPFPFAERLAGRVRLAARAGSAGSQFDLTLLRPAPGTEAAWLKAWKAIIPARFDEDELLGLKFAGRLDGTVPGFRWPIMVEQGFPKGFIEPDSVQIARKDLRVELVSPNEQGDIDGVAPLAEPGEGGTSDDNNWVKAKKTGTTIEFTLGRTIAAAASITIDCAKDAVAMKSAGSFDLKVNVDRLATDLRTVYGLQTPPPVPAIKEGERAGPAFGQPLIPAFVPLDDGWLQLPIPNLGLVDTSSDPTLVVDPSTRRKRSVIGDGFFRLKRLGPVPGVISAYKEYVPDTATGEAPWSVTIERATELSAAVVLMVPGQPGGTTAKLASARITLGDVTLSTRGLIWVSADRPDALEALPRFGAGPGSFLDMAFESGADAQTLLHVGFSDFTAEAKRKRTRNPTQPPTGPLTHPPTLERVELALDFDSNAQRWKDLLRSREARDALAAARFVVDGETPLAVSERRIIARVRRLEQKTTDAQQTVDVLLGAWKRAQETLETLRQQLEDDPQAPTTTLREAQNSLKGAEAALDPAKLKLAAAQEALAESYSKLDGAADRRQPWSPVRWRRHPVMPLAAAMPMTRVAESAVRPLESRDLIPFARPPLDTHAGKPSPVWRLATLTRLHDQLLPGLQGDDDAQGLELMPAWPWDDGGPGHRGMPDRGIAFAALGLPGVELRPVVDKGNVNKGKLSYQAALRFDLPALDEAFATAPLPPQPGGPASREEREQEPPRPVATALDWPLLAQFWREQERKHQNARVADSYMMRFSAVNDPLTVDVETLVRGLKWEKVAIRIASPAQPPLPPGGLFGTLSINGKVQAGNAALKGYSGKFKPDLTSKTMAPLEDGGLTVVGFSPSTFRMDDVDYDNRLSGAKPPAKDANILSRPVTFPGDASKKNRLVSLLRPISVPISVDAAAGKITRNFSFWFKDVLFDGDSGMLDAIGAQTAFDIWDEPAKLARGGFEWRFAPANEPDAEATIRRGRDEMPFFGFRLEPLRLIGLSLKDNKVLSAVIVCRLNLGESEVLPGNLLTMTLTRQGATDTYAATFQAAALRYAFTIADGDVRRRVVIDAEQPNGKPFGIKPREFSVAMAGIAIPLGEPTLEFKSDPPNAKTRADRVIFRSPQQALGALGDGDGRLAITAAQLTCALSVSEAVTGGAPARAKMEDKLAQLDLSYTIEIAARDDEVVSAGATIEFTSERKNAATPTSKLSILGQAIALVPPKDSPLVKEGDAVLALALAGPANGPAWVASCGLVVRLARPSDKAKAQAALLSGYGTGELVQMAAAPFTLDGGITVKDGRLGFALSATDETSPWLGTATVSGRAEAVNAIGWPALTWDPPTFPMPGDKPPTKGRVTIRPDLAGVAAEHTVTWTFCEHRISLARAAAIARKSAKTAWLTPVTARHVLKHGAKTISWTAIETIAIGAAAALIPPSVDPRSDTSDPRSDTSTTFAARYKGIIKKGKYEEDNNGNEKIDPGMFRPGLGTVATVLQGALGAAFRKAFWSVPRNGIMVAGGFLGALQFDKEDVATVLRLPVLAGVGGPKINQTVSKDGVELSWTDGPAARLLALTRPGGPSPANASLDALSAAIRAGSQPIPPLGLDATLDDPVGGLLVEQSFVNSDLAADPKIDSTPFFLAAAVSVTQLLSSKRLPGTPTVRVGSLSLVAGSTVLRHGKEASPVPLAAAIAMRDAEPIRPRWHNRARIAIVGDDVSIVDWSGPAATDQPVAPLVTGVAVANDKDPRAALVISFEVSDNIDVQRHVALILPREPLSNLPAVAGVDATFPDHGRGSPCAPDESTLLRWLAPVVEGPGHAIRDEDPEAPEPTYTHSGLSGLARRLALPAHAAKEVPLPAHAAKEEPANQPTARDFVWLSQMQVPIFLPLKTKELKGPPIGWLTPAPPRVRLPLDSDVFNALRTADSASTANTGAEPRVLQPFLPQAMDAASVGARAGVMTTLRTRLLSALGAIEAYDPDYSRFGRPAQGGSSFARQLRTPRPAALPVNTWDPARDRRIQASVVQAETAFSAVVGAADVVQGVKGALPAWAITVIAAPGLESTVTDQWDGTVRLVCRVHVVSRGTPGETPFQIVTAALIKEGENKRLRTRGGLKIGDTFIPFGRAVFKEVKEVKTPWVPLGICPKPEPFLKDANGTPLEAQIYRGEVDIILDPRPWYSEAPDPVPRVHPIVARALAVSGPLPAIEVQWTVHPSSSSATGPVNINNPDRALTIADPQTEILSEGTERAPLTLRMPLYPTTAQRGALPLTPATLTFGDPAYDRDLAGPPHSDALRLTLKDDQKQKLPAGRGELLLALTADRSQVNRRGVVTFMLDVRLERPMDDVAQARAEVAKVMPDNDSVCAGGDLMVKDQGAIASLRLRLQPKGAAPRPLRISVDDIPIRPGTVYELPLAAVTETDGSPARLVAGDILVMEISLDRGPADARLWNSSSKSVVKIDLLPVGKPPSRTLLFVLTDDPVIEPPPALYAALLRTKTGDAARIAVPLHAQSPLPWRVDLVEPARDFRRGMIRRQATFVWRLARPRNELQGHALYVIKNDRNGQTYLPDLESDFTEAEIVKRRNYI